MGMTDGQKELHKLLKEIDAICKKHNITYYAAGGTMIGAVRHRGFLPWDDDADIYMTRDEFNKLVEVSEKEGLPAGRVLGCQELDREYTNVFGRYIDTTTTSIHRAQLAANDEAGEVIDILQLDPVPRDEDILKKHFELLLIYSDIINENAPYIHRTDVNEEKYRFYMDYMKKYGKTAVLEKIEEQLLCYDEKDCDLYFMRWGGSPIILEKSMFSTVKYVEMEGINLPIPVNYNEYLVYHYGYEWEQVPSVKHQMTHDTVHCVHQNHHTIKKTYRGVIDTDRISEINQKNKDSKISTHAVKHYTADTVVRFRGAKIGRELLTGISKKNTDLLKLYNKHDYERLNTIFKNYYNAQNHAQFSGRDTYVALYRYQHPILIDLPTDVFTIAMKTQADSGKVGRTLRTLDIYEQVKGKLPHELKMLKNTIHDIEQAKNHYYLDEYSECAAIAEKVLVRLPYNFGMIKLYVRSSLCMGITSDKVKKVLKRGLKAFPENGDLIKLQADLLFLSDRDKALKKYLKARHQTSNGIVLLDINDILMGYQSELLQQFSEKYGKGEKEKARAAEDDILKIDDSPLTRLSIISAKLRSNPDKETAYKLYKQLYEFKNTDNDKRLKSCLQRALYLCGEDSFINKIHTGVFFSELSLRELDDMLAKADKKTLEDHEWELKKYRADLLFEYGDIREAYKNYTEALRRLPDDCVAYKDIRNRVISDYMHFEELEQLDTDAAQKNALAKYGGRKRHLKLLDQLGETVVYHESEADDDLSVTNRPESRVFRTKISSDLGFSKKGKAFAGWKAFRDIDNKWLMSGPSGTRSWENKEKVKKTGRHDYYLIKNDAAVVRSSPGGTLHLYAQWKSRDFTVLYHPGNDEDPLKPLTKIVFGKRTKIKDISELKLKRSGCRFTGWKVYRDMDDKWLLRKNNGDLKWMKLTGKKIPSGYSHFLLADGGSLTKTSSGGTVHLYAQWKKLDYTMVLYHENDTKKALAEKTRILPGKCTKIKTITELKLKNKKSTFTGWKARRDTDDTWLLKDPEGRPGWFGLDEGKLPEGCSFYYLKDGIRFAKTADASNVHLYAQWK